MSNPQQLHIPRISSHSDSYIPPDDKYDTPAPSSSRPTLNPIPQTMLSNNPLSNYSYPLPPIQHQTTPQNDLQNLACLTQPLPNPLDPSIHQHPIHHHHHHPMSSSLPHPSSLNAVAEAAAAAAAAAATVTVAPQPERQVTQHPSPPIQQSTLHNPPYTTPVLPQHQRQPSPPSSEPADAPSTDVIGSGSTPGTGSTVGAPSLDGAAGLSGTSSGNATEDRVPLPSSAAPSPPHLAPVSEPPSTSRRRSAEQDSPHNPRPNKRPHRSISHAEKRRLCEISNAHPSAKHGHIASVFQRETGRRIERSTVTRVLQRKDFWMSAGNRDSNRKRLTSPRFPTIEEALFELIRNRTRVPALRAMLTDKELMRYSKDIAEVMRNDNGSMDKNSPNYAPHLRSFRGSLSWVTSFKKRNALMSPEENRPFPLRPFVSSSLPGEMLDIWQTELNISETTQTFGEYTRLEDIYFLDAIALAASARPENAAVSSRVTPLNYDATAGIDEAFGIVDPQNHDRDGPSHEPNPSAIPQIDFSMPILSSNGPGMSHPMSANDNSNLPNGIPSQPNDNYPGMSSAVNHSHPVQSAAEARHPVDEDTIVYALFCSNGVGNDKRPPWIIGKKALVDVGNSPGEVWPGTPVRYFHNKQGWLTGRLTRKWMEEFDKSLDRNVIVVTSLLNSCDVSLLDLKHITVLPIPRTELVREKEVAMSWSSLSASPMHHGIEQMFRAKYRSLVMERALQQMGEQKPLKDLPLKEVATTVKDAWDKVPVHVIRRAWRELSYLPARFNRSPNRPRSNGNKPMWGQTLLDLSRLLMTYRDAISSYQYAERIELRQSDVFAAVNELSDYIWLPIEEGPFHPSGTILEFARSACADTPVKDDGCDQAKVVKSVERTSFQIENHEDALDFVNKLANFIKSDPTLGSEHNLYLAGSLQLEVKKECERRRNEAEARNWIESNRQRSNGLP